MGPHAAYAWIANADPRTGRPAVLGEVLSDEGETDRVPDQLERLDPVLRDQLTRLISTDGRPLRRLVLLTGRRVEVVREEPLELSLDAQVRFLECQSRAGAVSEATFLRAFPPLALVPARSRIANTQDLRPVTRGVPCSPGCGTGLLRGDGSVTDETSYLVALDRVEARHTALLRDPRCVGVVAVRASQADHFALLARESGFGYLALPHAVAEPHGLRVGGAVVPYGAQVTADFTQGTLFLGAAQIAPAADDGGRAQARALLARRRCPVRVTIAIDEPGVVEAGLPDGAQGIGLLRMEHLIRLGGLKAELARVLESERSAPLFVQALVPLLERVLRAVRGQPVAVRLLDLPVRELPGALADAADPGLGLRGIRQGVRWPHAYRAQLRALVLAAAAVSQAGGAVSSLRILVPMVCSADEVRLVRSWAEAEADDIRIGAMLETPAALALVEEIAGACEFALFGTNDLTSLCLGVGREDAVSVLEGHVQRGLLAADPFESLHPAVLQLVEEAARRARAARPGIELGLCGRHARDPGALDLALGGAVDHLCVEPADVDLVRLAAWQRAAP